MIIVLFQLFLLTGQALAIPQERWVSIYNELFQQSSINTFREDDVTNKLQLLDEDQPEDCGIAKQVTMKEQSFTRYRAVQEILPSKESIAMKYLELIKKRQLSTCEQILSRDIVQVGEKLEAQARTDLRALQREVTKLQPNNVIQGKQIRLNTLVDASAELFTQKRIDSCKRSVKVGFEKFLLKPCGRVQVKLTKKVARYTSMMAFATDVTLPSSPEALTYVNYVKTCRAVSNLASEIIEKVHQKMEQRSRGRLQLLKPRFTGLFGT